MKKLLIPAALFGCVMLILFVADGLSEWLELDQRPTDQSMQCIVPPHCWRD